MDNKEQCRKLANRIYELDEKVYKTSGSGLGKTFTGEPDGAYRFKSAGTSASK